jgi:TusA-related sulfurtransferase
VWADDPETVHDMPLLAHRGGVEILSVEEHAGEYRFLLKVTQ